MLERYLIDHCSPTLASLKTANMFSCPYESGESLEEDVHKWNLQMKDKGLYLTILRKNDKKALVYLCRPQRLEQDLHKPGVQKFLRAIVGKTLVRTKKTDIKVPMHLFYADSLFQEIGRASCRERV